MAPQHTDKALSGDKENVAMNNTPRKLRGNFDEAASFAEQTPHHIVANKETRQVKPECSRPLSNCSTSDYTPKLVEHRGLQREHSPSTNSDGYFSCDSKPGMSLSSTNVNIRSSRTSEHAYAPRKGNSASPSRKRKHAASSRRKRGGVSGQTCSNRYNRKDKRHQRTLNSKCYRQTKRKYGEVFDSTEFSFCNLCARHRKPRRIENHNNNTDVTHSWEDCLCQKSLRKKANTSSLVKDLTAILNIQAGEPGYNIFMNAIKALKWQPEPKMHACSVKSCHVAIVRKSNGDMIPYCPGHAFDLKNKLILQYTEYKKSNNDDIDEFEVLEENHGCNADKTTCGSKHITCDGPVYASMVDTRCLYSLVRYCMSR